MYRCSCSEQFHNQANLDDHIKNCKKRYFTCQLCNENVASCDMNMHLLQCATKTTKCSKCQKYIQRGIYAFHLDNNCIDLDDNETKFIKNNKKNSELATHKDFNLKELDCEELLFTNNNPQIDDIVLIPCEFCNEQIQSSLYPFHSANCSSDQHSDKSNSAQNTKNPNRYEKKTESKSNEEQAATKLINSSTSNKSLSKEAAVSHLHEKAAQVHNMLGDNYYPTEINHVTDKVQFNIVLTGPPRVGKSQLINALCGADLAQTSASLNSCTKEVTCYTLEDNQQRTPGIKPFRINFYDTPGIESWIDGNGQTTMLKFIEEKDPVCLIFCASPGAFANLKQLRPVLEYCQTKQIFCALVCTNMWADGMKRQTLMQEFKDELFMFGEPVEKLFKQNNNKPDHKVTVFGKGALCTMVNSIEYHDEDLSPERKPVQGIDELIHCIMEALDQDKLLGWCNAVLYRRSYWEKFSQRVNGFFALRLENISDLSTRHMTADQIALNFVFRVFDRFRK